MQLCRVLNSVLHADGPPADSTLLDGWDIYAWRDYALKKSKIASNVCSLNGKLKDQNMMMKMKAEAMKANSNVEMSASERQENPFSISDPWAFASQRQDEQALGAAPVVPDNARSAAWANWKPYRERPLGLHLRQVRRHE